MKSRDVCRVLVDIFTWSNEAAIRLACPVAAPRESPRIESAGKPTMMGVLVRAATEVGVLVRGCLGRSAHYGRGPLGLPAARRDGGGCLGPEVGVLVREAVVISGGHREGHRDGVAMLKQEW
jgi:hypothetical protein